MNSVLVADYVDDQWELGVLQISVIDLKLNQNLVLQFDSCNIAIIKKIEYMNLKNG